MHSGCEFTINYSASTNNERASRSALCTFVRTQSKTTPPFEIDVSVISSNYTPQTIGLRGASDTERADADTMSVFAVIRLCEFLSQCPIGLAFRRTELPRVAMVKENIAPVGWSKIQARSLRIRITLRLPEQVR